ncbi:hypothetical protein [Lactobacillus johnsonii]|uniref:hypothetical protein n=1 Tax=Lactobacillus johnsonii TaxID=33959 RepID=UPI00177EF32A|nr:hypothetical protein [Lactobacillus johnsonii]QXL46999.1 hypothetical protein IGB12_06145 [Lactobacillus johnsonii]
MTDIKKFMYNLFCYVSAAIFIYDCRSMYSIVWHLGNLPNYVLIISILGSMFVASSAITVDRLRKLVIISLGFMVYMGIYAFFSINKNLLFWLTLIVLLFIWQMSLIKDKEKIPKILLCYKNLLFIVALISLFFWLFGSILNIIKPNGVVLSSWGAIGNNLNVVPNFHNLYFETQNYRTGIEILNGLRRNSAIFTEAPMAALNFSIALLIEFLIGRKDKKSRFIKAILVITILTTFSTTGYMFLIMLFFGIWVSKGHHNVKNFQLVFIPILFVLIVLGLRSILTEKTNNNFSSVSVRLDDFKVGLMAWKQNVIFGIGVQNYKYLSQLMGSWRSTNLGFSNSLTDILSGGGLYLTLLYVFCFIRGLYLNIVQKNWKKVIFVVLMIYLFVTTFFTYTLILLYLLVWFAMGMSNVNEFEGKQVNNESN